MWWKYTALGLTAAACLHSYGLFSRHAAATNSKIPKVTLDQLDINFQIYRLLHDPNFIEKDEKLQINSNEIYLYIKLCKLNNQPESKTPSRSDLLLQVKNLLFGDIRIEAEKLLYNTWNIFGNKDQS